MHGFHLNWEEFQDDCYDHGVCLEMFTCFRSLNFESIVINEMCALSANCLVNI